MKGIRSVVSKVWTVWKLDSPTNDVPILSAKALPSSVDTWRENSYLVSPAPSIARDKGNMLPKQGQKSIITTRTRTHLVHFVAHNDFDDSFPAIRVNLLEPL